MSYIDLIKNNKLDDFFSFVRTYNKDDLDVDFIERVGLCAAEYNNLCIVSYLYSTVYDYNFDNVAIMAARHSNVEIVRYLIRCGVKCYDEIAAVSAEVGNKHFTKEIISLFHFTNAQIIAEGAAKSGLIGIVRHMWDKGDVDCDIVACCAAEKGHSNVVCEMLERGAKDYDKIAEAAVRGGLDEIENELGSYHKDALNAVNDRITVLKKSKHLPYLGAIENNNINKFFSMLYGGLDCDTVLEDNFVDSVGRCAAENNNLCIISYLYENMKDSYDFTDIVSTAYQHSNYEIANYLVRCKPIKDDEFFSDDSSIE